jgi:hypothetical protein
MMPGEESQQGQRGGDSECRCRRELVVCGENYAEGYEGEGED